VIQPIVDQLDALRQNCEVCGSEGVFRHLVDVPEQRSASEPQVTAVLCRKHSDRLQSRVAHWLAAMTATEGHHVNEGRRLRDGEAAHLIRSWALAQGYPVGRTSLSTQVITAYRDAHAQVGAES
jgi:hypothetical protein